ncbi:MAG: lytic transglycosylase domain-containing protein [Sphingobacteriales bacterium]|nr:MAG: lytic transglycosylase domain-containing protein [Sphingobacteriales bacterium]
MSRKVLIYTLGAGLMLSTASYAKKKDLRANESNVPTLAEVDPPKPMPAPPVNPPNRFAPPKLPASISFAGEQTPMTRWDVKERLDRELLFNTYMHGSTLYILKLAHRTFPVIERILREQGVPEDFKFLAVAESALYNQVSKAGATGYWQFMKSAGIQFGLEITDEVDMRYDLEASTIAACKYLKQAYAKFGNWTAAAASYNMGMGGYSNYSAQQYENNYYNLLLPEETNRYVYRILALKTIIASPEKHGFFLDKSDVYQPIAGKTVQVSSSIADLAAWAKQNNSTYQQVKLANQWLRGKSLTVKPGKVYSILIPKV